MYVWNKEVFHSIALEWGEVEELTTSKDQIFIGRVCIATQQRELISEIINLVVEGDKFLIRVTEDMIEILDFGPRYGNEDDGSINSDGMAHDNLPVDLEGAALADAAMDDPSEMVVKDRNRYITKVDNVLEILNELNTDDLQFENLVLNGDENNADFVEKITMESLPAGEKFVELLEGKLMEDQVLDVETDSGLGHQPMFEVSGVVLNDAGQAASMMGLAHEVHVDTVHLGADDFGKVYEW